MPVPKVAIVGRPNVGKSSLFNWLAGRTIAIVDPTAGVTRDRLTTLISHHDRYFEIIDTGGMGITDADNLTAEVEKQIEAALREADAILFVVDAREGVVPLDELVAQRLRPFGKPILVVANKADVPKLDLSAQEAYRLGYGEVLCVSAHQNRNKQELLDWIVAHLPPAEADTAPPQTDLKLAIVGRRNTGKSTFINSLAQAERVIVSEVPGTTRDSIDVRIERDGKTILAIDTAGVRKRSSIADSIEFYSLARAERSIRRADVVLLFFDPTQPVSRVDKQLAEYIIENHKPAIFVVNKWDLMKPMPTGEWAEYLRKTFPSLDYVPIAFITAKQGRNVFRVVNLAQNLHKQAGARVPTSQLNRVVREAVERQAPPVRHNRTPRIYFATQIGTHPPTIVLFTNGPELFDKPYLRYLLKWFRDHLPFAEVPIRLLLRDKHAPGKSAVESREWERAEESLPGGRGSEEESEREAVPQEARRRKKKASSRPDVWRDV
jgi:GTP-binding protein